MPSRDLFVLPSPRGPLTMARLNVAYVLGLREGARVALNLLRPEEREEDAPPPEQAAVIGAYLDEWGPTVVESYAEGAADVRLIARMHDDGVMLTAIG